MVDANAVEQSLLQPFHDQRMRLVEDVLTLDAQADQRVDIKEAAIAKLLIRRLPVSEAIVLLRQERVERVRVRVQLFYRAVNGLADISLFSAEPVEQPMQHVLIAMTRQRGASIRQIRIWQPAIAGSQKVQRVALGIVRSLVQDGEQAFGRHRKRLP